MQNDPVQPGAANPDDRCAARLAFQRHQTKRFLRPRMHEQIRGPIMAGQLERVGAILNPFHALRFRFDAAQLFALRSVANDQQLKFAWLAQGQGNKAEAAKSMRAAADLEDKSEKHVAMENRLYPMRELLADLLLAQGQSAAALTEYEISMKNTPERLRVFYGAAKAAEASGDTATAARYFEKLIRLTRNADSDRPEIREAKQFAAAR